ncbi:MAG: acyl-CoA dehydrogenase, partial [Pseudomonadota bacterium]|nr:acyl-CoA dehydrogenase [Pseudomonadota bacterium]
MGVTGTAQLAMGGDTQSEVAFDNVHVDGDALIGKVDEGWSLAKPMLERAVVLNCSLLVGAAHRAAERAFEYAKERVAFGHPIGSFQAIQHLCADMITWVDGAELLTREAAWHIAQGMEASLPVAAAKAFTNERCQMVIREANQIHGGYAQVKEFDQQLWYRRAAAWSMRLGTSLEHRKTVAKALKLG